MTNNTLTSEGDCLVTAECYGTCNSSESALLRNNIFVGQVDFLQPFENTCLAYQETFPGDPFDLDYSVITNTKDTPPCPGAHDLCDVSPGLANTGIDSFDAHLLASSPAIDAGDNAACPNVDFDRRARPIDGDDNGSAVCDMGAYERWLPTAWIYLPVIFKQ